MNWALHVDHGMHKGKIIPISLSPFVIGRHEDCQLRPSAPSVSHRHCALLTQGDRIILRDFESTNGTLINGRKVKGQIELRHGDRLAIGPLAFVVCMGGAKADQHQRQHSVPSDSPPMLVDDDSAAAILLGSEQSGKAPWTARSQKIQSEEDFSL